MYQKKQSPISYRATPVAPKRTAGANSAKATPSKATPNDSVTPATIPEDSTTAPNPIITIINNNINNKK